MTRVPADQGRSTKTAAEDKIICKIFIEMIFRIAYNKKVLNAYAK